MYTLGITSLFDQMSDMTRYDLFEMFKDVFCTPCGSLFSGLLIGEIQINGGTACISPFSP